MNDQYPFEGSISHGTLRPTDLLETFNDHMCAIVSPDTDTQVANLSVEVDGHLAKLREIHGAGEEPGTNVNMVSSELINELIDMLNGFAPEGVYFGAHEGDGADFGWWPVEYTIGGGE